MPVALAEVQAPVNEVEEQGPAAFEVTAEPGNAAVEQAEAW